MADNATVVSDTLVLTPTTSVSGTLHFEPGSTITLRNWSGSTANLLAGVTITGAVPDILLDNSSIAAGADVQLAQLGSSFGEYVVTVNIDLSEQQLTIQKGVGVRAMSDNNGFWVGEGATLQLEGEQELLEADGATKYLVTAASGGSVVCGKNCLIDSLDIRDGASLSAEGLKISLALGAYPGSSISGNIEFAEGSWINLYDMKGSTADLFANATLTGNPECAYLVPMQSAVFESGETLELTRLNNSVNTYIIVSGEDSAGKTLENHHLTLGEGVRLEGLGYTLGAGTQWILEGKNTISNAHITVDEGASLDCGADCVLAIVELNRGGSFTAASNGSMFDLTMNSGSSFVANNLTVVILMLEYGATITGSLHLKALTDSVSCVSIGGWQGSTQDLLKGVSLTSDAPVYVEFTSVAAGKNAELARLDERFAGYILYYTTLQDQKLVVNEGVRLVGCVYVQDGATFVMKEGSCFFENPYDFVENSITNQGGTVQLNGVDFAGAALVHKGGELHLTDCSGIGTLTLDGDVAQGFSVRNCDFTNTKIVIGSGLKTRIDLSDVEWGTEDIQVIISRIEGYNPNLVYLGDRFTLPADLENVKRKRLREGETRVTLKWTGQRGLTYAVKLDGEYVYEGKAKSQNFTLADGIHEYSVVAYDAAGRVYEPTGGFFVTDSILPQITMDAPEVVKLREGMATAIFNWSCSEAGVEYLLKVDGKVVSLDADGQYTSQALKTGRHRYELTTTDIGGNKVKTKGSFTVDATAPSLRLKSERDVFCAEGHVSITLNWQGEKNCVYSVLLNGETVYTGTDTQHTLMGLEEGWHDYMVIATDAAGNTTYSDVLDLFWQAGTLKEDSDDYVIIYDCNYRKLSEGKARVTVKWAAEKGVDYYVSIDQDAANPGAGQLYYVGKKGSYSFTAGDGDHSITVIAVDISGRRWEETQSLHIDTCAPAPDGLEIKVEEHMGYFTWNGTEGETVFQTLVVAGETYYGDDIHATLKEGKNRYTYTVMDEDFNKRVIKGTVVVDTKAPTLKVNSRISLKKYAEGMYTAALRWKGEKGARYLVEELILSEDGEETYVKVYEGTSTSYTLKLADNRAASYRITATDAAGNKSYDWYEVAADEFDASAPEFFEIDLASMNIGWVERGKFLGTIFWGHYAEGSNVKPEFLSYTVKVDGRRVCSNTEDWFRDYRFTGGKHTITVTAKDEAGNTATRSVDVVVDLYAETLTCAAPDAADATTLVWQGEDTDGVSGSVGKVNMGVESGLYRFELAEDNSKLSIQLRELDAAANLTLLEVDEDGYVSNLTALTAASYGLDRELTLSAGTYYLQVESCDSSKLSYNTAYELDLELQSSKGKQQAVLASSLA